MTDMTPLHNAAIDNQIDVAKRLLQTLGTEKDAKNAAGNTPMHEAARLNNPIIIYMLRLFGADVEARNNQQMTPLIVASKEGNLEAVKALIDKIPIDIANDIMKSPIHDACNNSDIDALRHELDNKVDPNALSITCQTPLLRACFKDNVEIVKMLIDAGADVNICDKSRISPLQCAAWTGSVKIVELLLEHNANPHAKNIEGKRPIEYAIIKNHVDIITLLEVYETHTSGM